MRDKTKTRAIILVSGAKDFSAVSHRRRACAVAKRERAVSMRAVAKKNGADRDNRRKKTAGAYFLYVTAVFTRNLIAVASKSAVEFGNRCGREA